LIFSDANKSQVFLALRQAICKTNLIAGIILFIFIVDAMIKPHFFD